jgi:16S rRNA (guanine(966)-N(2))-methyltransferase RsmD
VVDSYFLDLFAGTGAVGIEALSRGAKLAFFVELNRKVAALIRQNLEAAAFADCAEVYAVDVIRSLNLLQAKGAKFDIIFLGAPYDSPLLEKALSKIAESEIVQASGVVIAEHRKQHVLQAEYGKLNLRRDARYGETVLSFYTIRDKN